MRKNLETRHIKHTEINGKYLVSTADLGDAYMYPTIETMVFALEDGTNVVDWSGLDQELDGSIENALETHEKLCCKYEGKE